MHDFYSSEAFEQQYTYSGSDLGANWTKIKTVFRLWAPTAQSVFVNLYEGGTIGDPDLLEQIPMVPVEKGTWVAEKSGDLNGVYYTFQVTVDGRTV